MRYRLFQVLTYVVLLLVANGCGQHMADHPRLVLSEKKIEQVMEEGSKTAVLANMVVEAAGDMLALDNPEYEVKGRRLLGVSRTYLKQISYLAFSYHITGDERYLEKAESLMLTAAGFPDWNPSHFLDVAEMTTALSIGYDWLYNDLEEKSRSIIREAILKHGLEPSLTHNHWLTARHNWNQVCNAGMIYGAWAIFEEHPELAQQIIDRTVESIMLAQEEYNPEGVYPEGPGYWNYGTTFNTLYLGAWGTVYPHQRAPITWGLRKTSEYFLHVHGPTGSFNYSDGGSGFGLSPAAFWFAYWWQQGEWLFVQDAILDDIISGERNFGAGGSGDRLFPFLLMWYADLKTEVDTPAVLDWSGQGSNSMSFHRTSWDDDALYIAVKGGSPSLNHAHMDAGSFVLDAFGVRWAIDLGSHDYHKLEAQGVDLWNREQESQRWDILRYNNASHNTLVVDGKKQIVESDSRLIITYSTDSIRGSKLDISEAYAGSLDTALRSVMIIDNDYVRVRDELRNNDQTSDVRWAFCTHDNIQMLSLSEALILKDGKRLRMKVNSPSNAKISLYSTTPENDFEDDNPGTVMLGFTTKLNPGEQVVLEVELHPLAN